MCKTTLYSLSLALYIFFERDFTKFFFRLLCSITQNTVKNAKTIYFNNEKQNAENERKKIIIHLRDFEISNQPSQEDIRNNYKELDYTAVEA